MALSPDIKEQLAQYLTLLESDLVLQAYLVMTNSLKRLKTSWKKLLRCLIVFRLKKLS